MINKFDTIDNAVNTITKIVCDHFSADVNKICEKHCLRKISLARSFSIYFLHAELGYSASKVSKAFNLNRRSIFGNCEKTKIFIDLYEDYKEDYLSIKNKLLHL